MTPRKDGELTRIETGGFCGRQDMGEAIHGEIEITVERKRLECWTDHQTKS